ncbi:MAG: NUDIX domain-containing protein [Promethearchaeota archaeon]
MPETIKFIYNEEYWYLSAFIDDSAVNKKEMQENIENLIKNKLSSISDQDLTRLQWPGAEQIRKQVLEMCKNIQITCEWNTFMSDFPYIDENTEKYYNVLGYFSFKVTYFNDNPDKKQSIKPILIQQIPIIVKDMLQEYSSNTNRSYLYIDVESPIFVFVTANNMTPENIQWSIENIKKFKKIIGQWTEIYSGSWPDYNESLYDKRITNNLSNRLSELHFIKRNSGFIYMAPENYKLHFQRYMIKYVLEPTAKVRAMVFALISINHSLDILFLKRHSHGLYDVEVIEEKLDNLRFFRGLLQTKMGLIHDELDFNRRQHYTSVLVHLLKEFNMDELFNRVNTKFDIIYNTIQELYTQKTEENQKRTSKALDLLNFLFSLGIFSDLIGLLTAAISGSNPTEIFLNGTVFFALMICFAFGLLYLAKLKIEIKKQKIAKTVDAVIIDDNDNVLLIKRDRPPFIGYHALPGTFIRDNENEKKALERMFTKELDAKVEIKQKIGIYKTKGRDPRGDITTNAYLCKAINISEARGQLISIDVAKEWDLAFDHEDILKDALKLIKNPRT